MSKKSEYPSYKIPPRVDSAEIARHIEAFVARGGCIQQIPDGVSAVVIKPLSRERQHVPENL